MYATKNVRPRSSLSTDENHRVKDTPRSFKRRNNTLLTLVAFCIFLLVLCIFLLGALVYVGKNIAEEKSRVVLVPKPNISENVEIDIDLAYNREQLLSTKPILSVRTAVATTQIVPTTKKRIMATVSPAIKAASKVLEKLKYRLPRELRPRKYKLHLQPDLNQKNFTGNVTIDLEVLEPISFIPVHTNKLNVSTQVVQRLDESGAPLRVIEPRLSFIYPDYEYWVTEFAEPLEKGNYSLNLKFSGSLVDRITGFYQSSYLDKRTNRTRWIATSKFEPTFARLAFPCFDEPSLKAQFVITIVRPTDGGYHALSNMNVESEVVNGNLTEVTFADSVPMSTYLVSFIVSDFAHKTKTIKSPLEGDRDFDLRVFATPAQVDKVQYALDTAAAITEYYIGYFNVSYPLPKLDMAAIPDFVSGAMENWGLVTYRETALLYDPEISSSANQQRVASVIAHELAHMWFGNLVTMKWWNDLWLNEGFASYIEYKGVHQVHPDWAMPAQFLIDTLHDVLKLDATLASHPIVQTVDSPDQITELFDSITYSKGSSLVRMLENLVSEELFRNATTRYLLRHYYDTATTDDYLTAIEEENLDFDVKLIMQTWTEQMGLPLVEITKDGNNYKLTQKRFLSNPDDYNRPQEESQFNYRWSIPITYVTSADQNVRNAIFNYNDNELTVTVPSDVNWIKFNKDQVGYYRVNYPAEQWQQLSTALNTARGDFSVSDRAHLINDAFSLADANQLSYSTALDLSTYLEKELDYVPWSVASYSLKSIRNLLYYTNLYSDFSIYARKLITPVVEAVSFEVNTDHLQNRLRSTVLGTACSFGHEVTLQEAATRFTAWLEDPSATINPNIRDVVYYYGMQQTGSELVWDKVWQLYLRETDAQEKVKLMQSLAAVRVPWILQRYINLAWDEKNVRGQDYFSCLQYISSNPIGQSLVWDYVRENWQRLVDRFGLNERYLGRLIPVITKQFATQTKLGEMEAFFTKYPDAGAGTAARRSALETVKNNIKWLQYNQAQVGEWLANRPTSVKATNRIN